MEDPENVFCALCCAKVPKLASILTNHLKASANCVSGSTSIASVRPTLHLRPACPLATAPSTASFSQDFGYIPLYRWLPICDKLPRETSLIYSFLPQLWLPSPHCDHLLICSQFNICGQFNICSLFNVCSQFSICDQL